MSSAAQIAANRENATYSSGPTSEAGRAIVSQNRASHGLTGETFNLLPAESEVAYRNLCSALHAEHQPTNDVEVRLVDTMAQEFWRMQRAIRFQDELLAQPTLNHQALSLYLRYQTTHERAYYRAMHELQNLRKLALKQQIGFESQKRHQEMHQAKLRLTNARAAASEIDTEVKTNMEVPLPGHAKIPFQELKAALSSTLRELNHTLEAKLKQQAA